MRRQILSLLFSSIFALNFSCNTSGGSVDSSESIENYSKVEENETEAEGYKDGTYCAEVEYYNPSTGTRNTYDLDVEVEGGELTLIHWPNNGWLDNSHFYPEDITDGECEFISDKGYQYTVTLGEPGGCGYTDEYKIRRDVNDEIVATTCPKCGDEKDSYDNYCFSCKMIIEDEEENTCSRCGSYEIGVYGGLCSSCKSNDEEGN